MFFRVIWLISCVLLAIKANALPAAVEANYAYLHSEQPQPLSNILSLTESNWTAAETFGSHGFQRGEFWLRVHLNNTSSSKYPLILRFTYPLHDEVDFYEFDEQKQLLAAWKMGDMRSLSSDAVMDKHPAIKMTLAGDEEKWIYARVSGLNAMVLSIDILSEQEHQNSVHIQGVFSGLIYGALIVMALYNFILAVSMRDKAYYVYVAYVMTFLGLILVLTGDGFYYLWPQYPEFNQILLPVFAGGLIIPSLFFPYYLLNIRQHAPNVIWIFKVIAFVTLAFIFAIPILGIAKSIVVINALAVILTIGMLLLGFYFSYKRIPFARIYTFSWFVLLSGLGVLSLASLGMIENNLVTRNAGLLGGMIEIVILSLVLSQRITQEKNEKVNAIKEAMHNRKLFQELFDQAPIGIVRFDLTGRLVAINPMLIRMMEFSSEEEALSDAHVISNVMTDHLKIKNQLLTDKKVLDKEMGIKNAKGNVVTCSVSLHYYEELGNQYIEAYITDIRERIEAQNIREYMEKERLLSIEQLVTGVAHEVNTPLGVNITSISHIKEILDEIDLKMKNQSLTRERFNLFIEDSQQLLEIITHNLQKISNLIRRFKLVSVEKTDKVMMNIKQHLELSLHSHLFIGQNVEIELNCESNLNIESYPTAWSIIVEQLIENSVVHGFSNQATQKKITISVDVLDDQTLHFDYRDNGIGMDSDLAQRVFGPFVTTKRGSNDHAGLGLYRIYNLVTRVLNGEVSLHDTQGFHLTIRFNPLIDTVH